MFESINDSSQSVFYIEFPVFHNVYNGSPQI